jgi:spore maturation protein CgeB
VRFAIFGLTVSSSWGNGHATLWRGLIGALARRGHPVVFFERDVPYYAETRDLWSMEHPAELVLYPTWDAVESRARRDVADADVAVITSYCPDALSAADLVLGEAPALKVFYDLDTPVTLARLAAGRDVPYVPPRGLADFDLVLSFTGGESLSALREQLGAQRVAPLYGHVDASRYAPAPPADVFRCDLSFIGTYAEDRQSALQDFFVEPAKLASEYRFILAGSGYPQDFPWSDNIFFVRHLSPGDHPTFYCSSRLTLNVTRGDMARMGYCPSGRLFEAAACGVPILSDTWQGLGEFFSPGVEILTAERTSDALDALRLPPGQLAEIGRRARARVLEEHTSDRRAAELLALLEGTAAFEAGAETSPELAGATACGA